MAKSRQLNSGKTYADLIAEGRHVPPKPNTGWTAVDDTENGGPGFQGLWSNFTGTGDPAPASWYLSASGEVRMRGKITGGTALSTIFTLPEGFRPEFDETFACAVDEGGVAIITVYVNGDVYVNSVNLFTP